MDLEPLSRRRLLLGGLATVGVAAAGAAGAQDVARAMTPQARPETLLETLSPSPLVPEPQLVPLQPGIPPGQIHVVPDAFVLYWTMADGVALRFACGIGREGLYEPGAYTVGAKKEWPAWTPTPDMVARQPDLYAQYAEEGMPGGPGNPLGARALYLFTPERGDTFLRIHGTDAPETIGQAVSNGCARLVNDQIVDLYARVPEGAPVFLHPQGLVPAA